MSFAKDFALAGLIGKAAAYDTAPVVHRVASRRLPSGSFDQLSPDQQLKLAQEGSTILYAALRIIAVASATPPWVTERRKGDGWEVVDAEDPAAALVDRPNDFDDWRSFIERLIFCLIPTGNHLVHKVEGVGRGGRGADGKPITHLWPLLPVYSAELGDDDYPIRYKRSAGLRSGGGGRDYLPEEVIHFQRVNARSLGWGSGVVAAASRVIASEIATAEWQQESYENRLVPDGAFTSKAPLDAESRRATREAIEGRVGPPTAHEPLLLEGFDFTPFNMTPVEADYIKTRRAILEEVCAAVNIRPALLVPDAKYANLEQSRESLWLENVLPLCDSVAAKITRHLSPHFGRRGEMRWRPDYSKIEALRELLLKRVESFSVLLSAGTPYNHALELTGLPLPPLEPEIGDVPHGTNVALTIARMRVELGVGRDRLAGALSLGAVKALPALTAGRPRSKAEARSRTTEQFEIAGRVERRLAAAYRRLAAALAALDDRGRARLVAALIGGDAGAVARAAGTETLRAGLGLPSTGSLPAGVDPLLSIVLAGAQDGVRAGAAALSEAAGRDLSVDPAVARPWLETWGPERMQQVVESTERGLGQTLTEWRALPGWGETMAATVAPLVAAMAAIHGEQARSVRKVFGALIDERGIDEAVRRSLRLADKAAAERAKVIAEHNATRAVFGGQQQAAQDLFQRGDIVEGRRVWVDSDDDRVCPVCAALDGEEAALDEPYFSPADGGSYFTPGDPHNRCRCGELYFEIVASEAA